MAWRASCAAFNARGSTSIAFSPPHSAVRLRAATALLRRSLATQPAAAAGGEAYPSFSRGLFRGRLDAGAMLPYPAKDVLTPDQSSTLSMLVDPVTKFFTTTNDAAANDLTGRLPDEIVQGLRELGAFGLQVPEEYGGLGLSNTGYARMVEVVGAHDLGLGIFLGAHQSIGYKGILLFGTDQQKAQYLPKLASGEHVASFALTETGTGSDAASVKTRAVPSADGSHYVLNGSKLWISNGNIADVLTVFAQTPVTDPKTGETRDKMTAFVVERAFGGVTSGKPEKKLGIRCSPTAEVYFTDCKVPTANILLAPGEGFKVSMAILNNGRFGMGAALTGTMKYLLKGVTEHTAQRAQFGRKLREFQGIKAKIATMAARTYGAESLAYLLAANMDRGMVDYQLEAAVSKIYASEAAWDCADDAVQLMGGLGYMASLPYERILRDARIFRIFEGANDILRQFVSLTGIQSLAKADLEPLQRALKSPLSPGSASRLAPFLLSEARARMGVPQAAAGGLQAHLPPHLAPAAQRLEAAVARMAPAARALAMAHGRGVVEHQVQLAALADVVIDVTVCTAALSRAARAHADGLPSAAHEGALASLLTEQAAVRMGGALRGLASGGTARMGAAQAGVAEQVYAAGGYAAGPPLGF